MPWWLMQRREGGAETQAETRVRGAGVRGATPCPRSAAGPAISRDGRVCVTGSVGRGPPPAGRTRRGAAAIRHKLSPRITHAPLPTVVRYYVFRVARAACCENRMVARVVSNFFLNYQLIFTFPLERRLCRVASPSARCDI